MIGGQMLFSPYWSSVSSPRLMKRSSAIENNCSSRNNCPEVAWPQRVALSQSCNTPDSHVFPPLMDGDSQCSRERARHNSWSVGHCCQMWVAFGIFLGFCANLAGLNHVETSRSAPLLLVPATSSPEGSLHHAMKSLLQLLGSIAPVSELPEDLFNIHTKLRGRRRLSGRPVSSAGVQVDH